MINDIKTIISDKLLYWALLISPNGRKLRLANFITSFLQEELKGGKNDTI